MFGFDDSFDSDDEYVCDFDDYYQLNSLRNSIFADNFQTTSSNSTSSIYSARSSIHSTFDESNNLNYSKPYISDSLELYLKAPPLKRRAECLKKPSSPIDSTDNHCLAPPLSSQELYVGDLPPHTTDTELRDWFVRQNYRVSSVNIKTNKKGAHYAFVRFDSVKTAADVLFKSETCSNVFRFNGVSLNIKRPNPRIKLDNISRDLILNISSNNEKFVNVAIEDIYYGRLITGNAIKNIRRKRSIVSSREDFGIIANHLMINATNKTFSFTIDGEQKKITITSGCNLFAFDGSSTIEFEWNSHDLKDEKIMPIVIDSKEVYLLVKIKRPPIILETQNCSLSTMDSARETRLPGTSLIGHANAWIFKLCSSNINRDYTDLFRVLRRYNLSKREYNEDNIVHLIRSINAAKKNLLAVQLIANDDWVAQNQVHVDDFFQRRWKYYPFETKFEIMKLISTHIITVNDLIVDEEAEEFLKKITIHTLSAFIDKIIELAPRWLYTTCNEIDEQQTDDKKNTHLTKSDPNKYQHIRSTATGESIDKNKTKIDPFISTRNQLGTFSRLLFCAHDQLQKKRQLEKMPDTGIYVTKSELRAPNTNLFLLRKVYITPSTIFYEGPFREESCVVTRQFAQYQDRFLRVSFRDEDYRTLHNFNDNMSILYERIKQILINGISICDRHYQFLAFSSSQLREHSCWMFASMNDGPTVDSIRAWMGNFENVHPVAKYAARLGQLFSTSLKGLSLEKENFTEIADFKIKEIVDGKKYERCFTDGIGIISRSLAKRLAKEIKRYDENVYPSAFQIRCGGYKGMVCLDIFNRIKEANIDVYFRKSMNKFEATSFSIDLVRTSLDPSIAYLNRQIILLLSALGIPDKTFVQLQDNMLQQIRALTGRPKDARRALKDLNGSVGNEFHTFLISYSRQLEEQQDPFVRRLLMCFKAFLLKELRIKAKISVPNSWVLLGVIDESATLLSNQVFIQIDNRNRQKENPTVEILTGPVIVTRNPCFHPGDIRRLEAVDLPIFHDLKNVIVFSKNGPRPRPMEMSGGDLDGDTYWISQYQDFIFNQNEEPFEYQSPIHEIDHEVNHNNNRKPHTIEEVCNFFGEYIAADNLGMIANSHLVFADQSEYGVFDERCIELTRMHSIAVDFAKNGVSAPRLTGRLRPISYPHFLEKKDKKSYQSTTVLGILFDKIVGCSIDLDTNEFNEINATSTFPYQSFLVKDFDDYVEEARIIKHAYDRELKCLMRQYGIRNEVEIVSGYILEFTSKQYAKERKISELRIAITQTYRMIQDKYIRLFWQGFYSAIEGDDNDEHQWSNISKQLQWKNQLDLYEYYDLPIDAEEFQKKASAWFHVTYDPWQKYATAYKSQQMNGRTKRFKGFFSFAWLVYPILLKIYEDNH